MLVNNLFSDMKYTKSHFRTRLRDDHQHDVWLVSLTDISSDGKNLSYKKQQQVSHKIIYHF